MPQRRNNPRETTMLVVLDLLVVSLIVPHYMHYDTLALDSILSPRQVPQVQIMHPQRVRSDAPVVRAVLHSRDREAREP